jgi:hypothetical protein
MKQNNAKFAAPSFKALLTEHGLSFDTSRRPFEETGASGDKAAAVRKFLGVVKDFVGLDSSDATRTDASKRVSLDFEDGTRAVISGTAYGNELDADRQESVTYGAQVIFSHMTGAGRYVTNTRGYVYQIARADKGVVKDVDREEWPVFDGQVESLGKLLVFATQHETTKQDVPSNQ